MSAAFKNMRGRLTIILEPSEVPAQARGRVPGDGGRILVLSSDRL
jgi:hypothetical protein